MNAERWQKMHPSIDWNDPHNFALAWDAAVRAGCEACAKACRKMEWQPIKTTPTKTPILITDGTTITATVLEKCGDCPKWMYGHGFSGYEWRYDFTYEQATHWMLLPDIPEKRSKEAK